MKYIKDTKFLILIATIIICFIAIIFTWNNESNHVNLICDTILISLAINIISSILLIYFLEERDKKRAEKERLEKQQIVFQKLIYIIKDFNRTIVDMYKATMKEKIDNNSELLNDLYYNLDDLYNQINKIDLNKNGNVLKRTKEIQYLNWYEIYVTSLELLLNKTKELINNYAFILDNDILKNLEFVDQSGTILYRTKTLLTDDLNQTAISEINGKREQWQKVVFIMSNLKGILNSLSKTMKYINKQTGINNFKNKIDDFNAENIGPAIGSGLL